MNDPLRVLLVEDNPGDSFLIEEMLQQITSDSLQVECVTRLSEAVSRLSNNSVDVILLDLGLPDSHGVDTVRRLKEKAERVPIVVLTGNDDERVGLASIQEGAQDYLVKGRIDGDLLSRVIRYAMERQQSLEKLRENERKFRALFEQSVDSIIVHDFDGTIIDANPHACNTYGYSLDELRKTNVFDLSLDEIESKMQRRLCRQLPGQGLVTFNASQQRKDGTFVPVEARLSIIQFNKKSFVMGLFRDTSERERGERQLRESETLFRRLFENHAAIKFIIDPETGNIIDANNSAASFYSWSREELKQMKMQDINTLTAEQVRQAMEEARAGNRFHFEFRHRRNDGSIRDVEVFSSKIEVKGKQLLHSIIHDITERKLAEAERERLLAAIEQAGESIVVTDAEGTILYVNPAFEKVSGYGREEVLGKNPRLLKSGVQDQSFYRHMWETIASGLTWQGRIVNRRKDGTLYTEDATISPVWDASGRIANYVAVKRDVSEHLQLAAQFQQAQKMESIGRLAGGVAHDYNNMLGVILGFTEMALAKVAKTDPLHADLDQIQKAARRSVDITRQLLAFARKQTIAPRVLDFNETVAGMLKMLQRLMGEDIELAWLPQPGLWPVKMDPSQIDQILANLCVNARDAIVGVGKVTIETQNITFDGDYCARHSGFVAGDHVLLAVSDDGCGMERETLEHIFEPFFTTKTADRGTGLGLAILYGIVKQNNGFINVYSEPGKGTTFRIYLPRVMGEAEQPGMERARTIERSSGETVVLVEDEPAMMKMAQMMLEQLGYHVLVANTPGEAMRLAEEHVGKIDLLITDVVMPEMNGRDLAHQLQTLYPGLRVLFMSGYTANTIVHQRILDEGVHFIQKPFSMQEFAARARTVLK